MKATPELLTTCSAERRYETPRVISLLSHGRREVRLEPRGSESAIPPRLWVPDFLTYPCIRPGLVLRELRGNLVIYDPLTGDHHTLNSTAAAILLLSTGARTAEEISVEHGARYGLEKKHADADVRRVLRDLIGKKLVIRRPERSPS